MIGRESVEYRDVILVTRFISSGDMIMQTSIAHLMIRRVLKDGKTSNLRISLKAHVLT